jgi:hypothetical protein
MGNNDYHSEFLLQRDPNNLMVFLELHEIDSEVDHQKDYSMGNKDYHSEFLLRRDPNNLMVDLLSIVMVAEVIVNLHKEAEGKVQVVEEDADRDLQLLVSGLVNLFDLKISRPRI